MGNAESSHEGEIGSRNSGPCIALSTSRREGSMKAALQHLGPGFQASAEERVGSGKEPRIRFQNKSSHRISYWVVQEDKTRTMAHHKRIESAIGVGLKLGSGGGSASGNASRETEETFDMETDAYFIMKDHRIEAGDENEATTQQTTEVVFPKDCKDLRVYGYFEEDGCGGEGQQQQQWTLFKNKVYSIGWFKKVFTLTALDTCISPYTNDRNSQGNLRCAGGG